MTYQQAVEGVEHNLLDAAKHLDPTPQLEISARNFAPCSGPNDTDDTGQVMVQHSYWLRGIPTSQNRQIYDQLKTYWKEAGYTIAFDQGPQPIETSGKTAVRHPTTGFNMSLTHGQGGALSMRAQFPCVLDPRAPPPN